MEYGYGRVSSKEQNLDRQIQTLLDAGVEKLYIYCDKESGKDFNRKSYNLLVGTEINAGLLREGDLLTIHSIDRLGRNYTEIMEQWKKITREIGADIRVLDMPLLDTRGQGSNLDQRFVADLVLQILSYVAEKERHNIKSRQKEGIRIAKEKGVHMGRPRVPYPDNWKEVYDRWKNKEMTAVKAWGILGLKKGTFYKLVKDYETKCVPQ